MQSFLLVIVHMLGVANAFTPSFSNHVSKVVSPFNVNVHSSQLYSASLDASSTNNYRSSKSRSKADTNNVSDITEDQWQLRLQTKEVQEVRQELIKKYVALGRDEAYAESEVDQFLNDPARSLQFLDMKRYAKEHSELGFETVIQYATAFLIGMCITSLPHIHYINQ